MPSYGVGYRQFRSWCQRKFSWSTHRGGCRFEPGHQGPCKPGRYR